MSVSIYAATRTEEMFNGRLVNVASPVVPFENWEPELVTYPENWDEDPIRRPNPDYVPDAGMNLSNANADALFAALGLPLDAEEGAGDFAIDAVIAACIRWTAKANFVATPEIAPSVSRASSGGTLGATMIDCGRREGYLNDKVAALHRLAVEGRKRGATIICAA